MNSYLLFHSVVEIFSIVVAWSILLAAWNARRSFTNSFFVFISVGYGAVGAADLLHTLAYKGMGIFPDSTGNLATQLWIVARYINAVTLLLAPTFLRRRVRFSRIVLFFTVAGAAALAAVFGGWFPVCFRPGTGLTAFKILSEYGVCALVAVAMWRLRRRHEGLDPETLRLLLALMAATICAELAFTLYKDVYGFFNALGHVMKVIAFMLLYRAVVISGIRRPFEVLFHDLRESEERFSVLIQNLHLPVALVDARGAFTIVNGAFRRMFDIEPDADILNINSRDWALWQVFDESGALLDVDDHPVRRAMQTRTAVKEQLVAVKPPSSANPRWLLVSANPLLNAAGEVYQLICTYYDITDRRSAGQALRESEEKYRNLFENMAEEVHFWQLVRSRAGDIETWRLVDANPPTLKTWGRDSLEEIRGKTTDEIFGPGSTAHYLPVVKKIFAEGRPYTFYDYFPNLDRHFRFTSVPFGEYFITTGADVTALRKAEESLRRQQEMLVEMGRIARVGGWEIDAATGEGTWTEEVARIHDLDPELPINKALGISYYAPDSRPLIEKAVREAVENARPYDLELELISAKGVRKWVRTIGRPVIDNGRVVKVHGSLQDITGQKEAQTRLRESEERFRLALKNAPVSVAVQDLQLRYIWAYNQRTVPHGGIVGKLDADIFTAEEAAHLNTVKRRVIEEEIEVREQMWLDRPGGRIFLDVSYAPLRDETGRVSGIGVATVDLTPMKLAEETLRSREATLRGILDATKESIFQFSRDGIILMANETAARRLGVTVEEVVGRHYSQFITPELAQSRQLTLEQVFTSGIPVAYEDERGGILFDHSFYPIPDADGLVVSVVVFSRDITERKRAEASLQSSLNEKVVLLKEVHHRVKNNLQIVASLLSLQAAHSTSQKEAEMLQDTRNRVKSMALLHETLYQSGNLAGIHFADYLKELCGQLVFSYRLAGSRVRMEYHIADVEISLENAVPCGLIASELVSNALKHGFPGDLSGRIRVGLEVAEDRMLILSVEDEGVGLPADFDLAATSTLGLQLVSGLSDQLGGSLDAGAAQGAGAVFRVIFPIPKGTGVGHKS